MKPLIVGGLYSLVNYSDARLLFPIPTAMIVVGKNIDNESEEDLWFFQDTDSYCRKGIYTRSREWRKKKDSTRLYAAKESQLHQIVDCRGLAEILLACKTRRANAGQPN